MIRPLDLQTLYMNLDKVGKEQAQSKEAQAQAQAQQVQRLQKEHDQGAHAVGRTQATGQAEGEHSVKVNSESGGGTSEAPPRRPRPENAPPEEEAAEPEAWRDPQLGKHIDLSG